ncbi:MAG: SIS domain-containing protein [Myxococcota bacterium]|nr:SIS domain-containing protein [Myxococcota bacterium]
MCGVIGLIFERHHERMGKIASELLRTLEYRGYDSTGAAIQGLSTQVDLRKGVGAPTAMVKTLGIEDMSGQILCGQVRWATFGAVDDRNAQPHVVRCKTFLYGAHNGNVTNCDDLKTWLLSEGHEVTSDNDGEMVVHTVEHLFALELFAIAELSRLEPEPRRQAMRRAIVRAGERLEGSFAAIIVDPISRCLWAIKAGSSLYFGQGVDPEAGRFCIASSDLSSVLKLTRVVVPLREGELVEFTPEGYQVMALAERCTDTPEGPQVIRAGQPLSRAPVRSRLRAKDATLLPRFETFMDQEISAQEQTCRNVISLFLGGSDAVRLLRPCFDATPQGELAQLWACLDTLRDQCEDEHIRDSFFALANSPAMKGLLERLPEARKAEGTDAPVQRLAERLVSSESGFLADVLSMCRNRSDLLAVRVLDALLESEEVEEMRTAAEGFAQRCQSSLEQGGNLYVACCGSSYHAAKAACLFFNELARVELIPILPGEFRGQYAASLKDGDLIVAVSQSGETKDLIDIMNDVIATGRHIDRIAVVNNVSSTLAQEKAHLVVPLRCGPEIAVPATKSFMNQMVVLYCLALCLGEVRLEQLPFELRQERRAELASRRERLKRLPDLIRETFDNTEADIERAAQLLYLKPSIHILATRLSAVAKEGALKIREVVLNHTEGFEGSEFKHGPNTILGFNTIFGPAEVANLLATMGRTLDALARRALEQGLGLQNIRHLSQALTDHILSPSRTPLSLTDDERAVFDAVVSRDELVAALYSDYPLIYVTGPDERDVALTVSQINTHKIRGASTVLIAEEHPALRGAATKAPTDNPSYQAQVITLPRTNDTLAAIFSAAVVLQRLALKMSLMKAEYLDRLGIQNHGVHPDVPKNVSKSITVD